MYLREDGDDLTDELTEPDLDIPCKVADDIVYFFEQYEFSSVLHAQHTTQALIWQMKQDTMISLEEQTDGYTM